MNIKTRAMTTQARIDEAYQLSQDQWNADLQDRMNKDKYYVYVALGHIEYFSYLDDAEETAEYYGTIVKEI